MAQGISTTYSLEPLGARGTMFIGPREDCYDGQIIGESSKEDDFEVNPTKAKALTNFRAAGKDDFVQLGECWRERERGRERGREREREGTCVY